MKGEGTFLPEHTTACRTTAVALLQAFRSDRFIFGYSAHFGDELSARLLDLSDSISEELGGRSTERKRLAFVLVEAYQNIIRHRAGMPEHIEQGEGRSFFCCRAGTAGQDVVAINGVYKDRVQDIAAQLDSVRGLGRAELKELSVRMLQLPATGRGAGVGFIEMARRSGNDLGHMLRGLGPEHALFALAVRTGEAHPHEKIIREAAILHGTVVMNDILLFHAGHTPLAVVDVITAMVRNDVEPVVDPLLAEQRGARYSAWARVLGELGPARRCACVLARSAAGLLLVQGVELDPQDVDEAVHAMARELRVPGSEARVLDPPELTVVNTAGRSLLLVSTAL